MFEFKFSINQDRCARYNYISRRMWRVLATRLPVIVLTFTQHRDRVRFGRPLFLKWQFPDQFLQNAFFHELNVPLQC